ncbi:MAG: RHS repeat-associated core domain-containing protein [Flavobacteriaceae bacterium]|nr:RHS repeat-associated core domain-containing protein [Flavobacteriaceae bacterium]
MGGYRYAYQGQEKDPETGKEAFEARLWDARIGRWLTTDPAGEFHSPYLGMANNPVSVIDPDGRCTTCPDNANVGDTFEHSEYGILTFSNNGWFNDDFGFILNDVDVTNNPFTDALPTALTITGLGLDVTKNKFLNGLNYNFYKNAPSGKFGVELDGKLKYWSNNFRSGTRAGFASEAVTNAKLNAKTAIKAGNGFKAVSSSLNVLALGYTVVDASFNWGVASDAQKAEWVADGVFGVLAFTPLAPVSTVYFGGKFVLSGSGPHPAFLGRQRLLVDERQIKVDNLRVHNTHHKILLK